MADRYKRQRAGSTGSSGRIVSISIAAAALLAFLFGCQPDERLALRVSTWSSPVEMEIMDRCFELFEQKYPQVRIVHESYPASYQDKVLTSIAAGTPPDVILLDSGQLPTFVQSGTLLDLAPYVSRTGLRLELFFEHVLDIARVDGKLYAFPKDFTPLVYFFNKRLFDQTGTPYPEPDWTWDDFLRTCRSLTGDDDGDGRPDRFGTSLERELFRWQPWVWSAGGDLLSPDYDRAVGYFDSPQTIDALRFLTDLVSNYKVTSRYESLESLSRNYDQGQKLFYSGKIGLFPSGHWWVPKLRKYMEQQELDIGVAPFPRRDAGGRLVTVMYESGWAVPRATRHRKWAVLLAAFLADVQCQRIRANSGLAISAMRHVAVDMVKTDPTGIERVFYEQIRYCRAPWGSRVSYFSRLEDVIPDVLDRVIIESIPVEQAAADLAVQIEALLEHD